MNERRHHPLERGIALPVFLGRVKLAIAESIRGSDRALEMTAKRLATSPRTLQRRLEEAGTSHTELVEHVRRDLSLALLANPEVRLGEIGYLVGFRDASAFYRAFRRWTGSTPRIARQSLRSQPRAEA